MSSSAAVLHAPCSATAERQRRIARRNVRIWKANAAAPLGTLLPREWKKLQYNNALVRQPCHSPQCNAVCYPARAAGIVRRERPPPRSRPCIAHVASGARIQRFARNGPLPTPARCALVAQVEKFKHVPEVARIKRHRHVPKPILKAAELRRTMEDGERRKRSNRLKHSAPGKVKLVSARKERVVAQQE